jgi:hypothetical protein
MISLGDDRLGIQTKPILLLTRADVRADLKLSPQAAAEAQIAIASLRRRAMTAMQKDARVGEAERREIDHIMTEWLRTHLSPQQSDRLHQIDLQWEGIAAVVHRPIVAEFMGISDSQRTSIRSLVNEHGKARGAQPPTLQSHAALNSQGLGVLSEIQRDKWQRLLGQPCPFAISAQPVASAGAATTAPATTPRQVASGR